MGALCLSVRFQIGNAAVERRRRADMLLVALIHRHLPIVQVGHGRTPFILPTILISEATLRGLMKFDDQVR